MVSAAKTESSTVARLIFTVIGDMYIMILTSDEC